MPKASFEKECILLDSEEIQLTIILEEKVLGIRIYNAIVAMKKEKVANVFIMTFFVLIGSRTISIHLDVIFKLET